MSVDPGNTSLTDEMKHFEPQEIIMNFGFFPTRLIFYCENDDITDYEMVKLDSFKEMCKEKKI